MKNIREEKVIEEAVEVKPEFEKRRFGQNALCWILICTVLLLIGIAAMAAVLCKIDLLVTVMLGGIGLTSIVIGLIGIIFGIVNPNNIMGD